MDHFLLIEISLHLVQIIVLKTLFYTLQIKSMLHQI